RAAPLRDARRHHAGASAAPLRAARCVRPADARPAGCAAARDCPRNVTVLALVIVSAIGVLIGLIGLGGFLLVPVLVLLQGTSTREAVVVAAVAFLAGGL